MYRTGAITLITDKLIGLPKSLLAAQVKLLPPVAVGSAFLNNTPLAAMFIPVIRDLAKVSRLPAFRLYIPLSFASILGGACTLIGSSTNLVVAGMVMDFLVKGDPSAPQLRQIAKFDLAWIGLPATIAGIVVMVLTSRFLLPGPRNPLLRQKSSPWKPPRMGPKTIWPIPISKPHLMESLPIDMWRLLRTSGANSQLYGFWTRQRLKCGSMSQKT
jgi:di/tricarboxylate transporter